MIKIIDCFTTKNQAYKNNVNKGTATVTLKGIDKYAGEKTVTFKIGQRSVVDSWKELFN